MAITAILPGAGESVVSMAGQQRLSIREGINHDLKLAIQTGGMATFPFALVIPLELI